MLNKAELELTSKYYKRHLEELEQAINANPIVGWPERGEKFKEWGFILTYPFPPAKPGESAGGWSPTADMIRAFQSLFGSDSFSVEVHMNGPHIATLEDLR